MAVHRELNTLGTYIADLIAGLTDAETTALTEALLGDPAAVAVVTNPDVEAALDARYGPGGAIGSEFASIDDLADFQTEITNTYVTTEGLQAVLVAMGGGNFTQEYPPAVSTVAAGDLWYVPSVGHAAVWNGSAWAPVTPTDPEANLCSILGSFDFLVDAEQYDSTTPWENLGLEGATLDGAVTGATKGVDGSGFDVVTFDGVDDYVQIPAGLAFGAADTFAVLAVASFLTLATNRLLIGNKASVPTAASGGWMFGLSATTVPILRISDGTNQIAGNGPAVLADTNRHLWIANRDVATDTLTTWQDGVAGTPATDTTTGALTGGGNPRIARLPAGTTYYSVGVYTLGVRPAAFTDIERAVIETWEAARWA